MDATGNMKTVSGSGIDGFPISCTSVYSAAFQKYAECGYVTVGLFKNGHIVNQQITEAPYGIAMISGSCK